MKKISKDEYKERQKAKVKELSKKLEDGIVDIFESGKYKEYLDMINTFHKYSYYNSILIRVQCPNATKVASYKAWEKLNRQVKKGEKAISIFAPSFYKVKEKVKDENGDETDEEKEKQLCSFKPVAVFDYSQTEGEELPEISRKLDELLEDADTMIYALQDISPVDLEFADLTSDSIYDSGSEKILINQKNPESLIIKSMIQEIAKCELRKDAGKDQLTMMIESESIGYIVSQYYGIDTSMYSFGEIAKWSGDKNIKQLKASLNSIKKISDEIIEKLDKNMGIEPATA